MVMSWPHNESFSSRDEARVKEKYIGKPFLTLTQHHVVTFYLELLLFLTFSQYYNKKRICLILVTLKLRLHLILFFFYLIFLMFFHLKKKEMKNFFSSIYVLFALISTMSCSLSSLK